MPSASRSMTALSFARPVAVMVTLLMEPVLGHCTRKPMP
jgi:hypothetical protein